MRVLHFNYCALRSYSHTYHPPEELRIQREINRLKADKAPLGLSKVPHISQNAQVRIIEMLVQELNLPHPRLLGPNSFSVRLPGWQCQLQGLYKYYLKIRPKEQADYRVVDFMLDYLGFQRLEELPPSTQARYLRKGSQRINWDYVNRFIKRWLVERLAEEAGVVHPRFLTIDHFRNIEIPEIESTLVGLHDNYADKVKDPGLVIDKLLDEIGVPSFDSLPWEQQLKGLKQWRTIPWERVPKPTQLRLVELLKERAPPQNGVKCPHLRVLTSHNFRDIKIEEIGTALKGLHEHYRRQVPKGYKGTAIDYMLDQLGIERFEELPYEQQCLCLRYDRNVPWGRVPRTTILRFMERLRDIHSLPHVRFVSGEQLQQTVIPEIGETLSGLYTSFRVNRKADDSRQITDIILDYCGAPKFSEMPFYLQLQWTFSSGGRLTSWGRVPDTIILYYLRGLTRRAGVRRIEDLRWSHFELSVGGKKSGLTGLYTYLDNIWPESGRQMRMLDWAAQKYGLSLQMQVQAKRRHRLKMLDQEEKFFLLQMAKLGDPEAVGLLIFFYEPLIRTCAERALWRASGRSRKTREELEQIGRINFPRLIRNYNPSRGSFETYARISLGWYMHTAIFRDRSVVHRPVSHLKGMRNIQKAHDNLVRKLNRRPTEEEWANELGLTVEELRVKRFLYSREVSLSQPLGEDDDFTLESVIPAPLLAGPERMVLDLDLRKGLERAIKGSGLTEREEMMLRMNYLEGHSQAEIARMLGCAKQNVNESLALALKKIANGPYATELRKLL